MAMRRKAARRIPPKVRPKPFLAPTKGWVTATNLAASPEGSASVLENFYPTTTGIKMRSGSKLHGTASTTAPLESGISYVGGTTRKMFGVADGSIFELTSPATTDIPPTADVTGLTSSYFSHVNFANSGGNYLEAVNGTDALQIYDGTDWYPITGTSLYAINYDAETGAFTAGLVLTGGTSGATATIVKVIDGGTTGTLWVNGVTGTFQDNEVITDSSTGSADENGTATLLFSAITGVATSALSHVNVYRNRLWFVEAGTMNAKYLGTDSITGSLSTVSLTGIFQKGGALLFTATWSFDAGNGPNEVIVFASTEGEYAVFNGDPVASDWGIIGLYDASPPLGKNATIRVGGDLLVITRIGLVPMSAIKNKDPAALAMASVSRAIQPDWQQEARLRGGLPWEIVKWTSRNIAYVSCPVTGADSVTPPICFAVNLETGAWCKITGWNTRCFILHDDDVYFGTNSGTLMQADITGSDNGEIIYYLYVGQADHLGSIGQTKTVRQARAIFRTKAVFTPLISVSVDYQTSLPSYPSAATPAGSPGEWDVGLWDVALWDTGTQYYTVTTQWTSIGATGFVHQPQLQITSGSEAAPSAELVAFDTLYEPAAFAV